MIQKISILLILLAQFTFAQDAKLTRNSLTISKVSKEALKIAKEIEEAKRSEISVVFKKTVTQKGFTRFVEKNKWITKVKISSGNENIGSLKGLEKIKGLKKIVVKSLKKSKVTPLDLAPLSSQKQLQKVYFYGTKITNTEALSNCKSLKIISLRLSDVSSLEFLYDTPLVEELDLYGDGHTFNNYNSVATLNQLKGLDISNNKQAVNSNLRVLNKLNSLKFFGMNACKKITHLDFLKNCVNLKKINGYISNGITDISALKHLTNLEEIGLSKSKVSDFSVLENCKKLQSITIRKTQCDNIDFIKKLSMLEYLDISSTPTTSIKSINNHPSIEHLDLEETLIDDVEDVMTLSKLKYIDIRKTSIKNLKPLLSCPKLKRIKLDKQIHKDFIKQSKKDHPKIKIY